MPGNKKNKYDVSGKEKRIKNGDAVGFENQLDDWYRNNKVASRLIPSDTVPKKKLNKQYEQDELDPEWEKLNLRYGWGRWTPE